MKAFLLVAGLGTRLRPLTNEIPKCLLPIDGKPLLQIWLENLYRHGVDEVLINTHWKRDKVEAFIGSYNNPTLKVVLFHEQTLLGSGGTLLANKDWISNDEPFFILYGDNLTNLDLSRMLSFHRKHFLPFTLGVFKADNPSRCGIAEVGEDDLVVAFSEKPKQPKSDLAAAGVYVADRRIFNFFPEEKLDSPMPLDLGFHVIPKLIGKMKAYHISEFLLDIGTPQSYEKAQILWKMRKEQVRF
jgi:mannose-1-phosphate guanylyltransferase